MLQSLILSAFLFIKLKNVRFGILLISLTFLVLFASNVQGANTIREATYDCSNSELEILTMIFSPDGKYIAAIDEQGEGIIIWDISTGKIIQIIPYNPKPFPRFILFSPNQKYIAVGDRNNATLWDITTGTKAHTFPRDIEDIYGTQIVFTSSGEQILVGGSDGASLWDIESDKKLRSFSGIMDMSVDQYIQLSSDNEYVLTMTNTNAVHLWDANTGKKLHTFENTWTGAFTPDSKYVLTIGYNGTLLWDIQTFKLVRVFTSENLGRPNWRFSADSKYVLIYFDTGRGFIAFLWNLQTGEELKLLSPIGFISEFLPDSKQLLFANPPSSSTTDQDVNLIRFWDIASQEVTKTTRIDVDPIAFYNSLDGQHWAAGIRDHQIYLYDLETGKEIKPLC